MKIILLIALIFAIASAEVFQMKKNLARTAAPETLALQIKYYGTCQEFKDRVLPTVWISTQSPCLPLRVGIDQNPDVNDLNAHYFCTKFDEERVIIHFVEIFASAENTAEPNFVLSLVPTNPFRVLTNKASVTRRPNCYIVNDYCNATNAVVSDCRTNAVAYKNKYVVNQDRIYITASQSISNDCKTGTAPQCCNYVTPIGFGGLCGREASKDLLDFPKRHHGNNHHDEHNGNNYHNDHDDHHDGRPGHDEDRDGHHGRPNGRPGHDEDRDGHRDGDRDGHRDGDRDGHRDGDRNGHHGRPGNNGRPNRPGPNGPFKDDGNREEDGRPNGRPGPNGPFNDDGLTEADKKK